MTSRTCEMVELILFLNGNLYTFTNVFIDIIIILILDYEFRFYHIYIKQKFYTEENVKRAFINYQISEKRRPNFIL